MEERLMGTALSHFLFGWHTSSEMIPVPEVLSKLQELHFDISDSLTKQKQILRLVLSLWIAASISGL
jgi:hypothetical protein